MAAFPNSTDQPYTLLPEDPSLSVPPAESRQRQPTKVFLGTLTSIALLLSLAGLIITENPKQPESRRASGMVVPGTAPSNVRPVGEAEGVSAKSYPSTRDRLSYNWTLAEFAWQRTAYHFQPEKNWMNGRCISEISLNPLTLFWIFPPFHLLTYPFKLLINFLLSVGRAFSFMHRRHLSTRFGYMMIQ